MNQVLFFSFNEFVVSTFSFQLFTLADALLLTLVVLWWLHMFESFLVAACKVVAQFRSLWLGYLTFISSCFVMSVGLESLLFSKNHVAISSTITWITHLNKSVATICRGSSASQIWYYKGAIAMLFQKVSRLWNAARLLFMLGYVCLVGFDILILHFACFYFSPVLQCCFPLTCIEHLFLQFSIPAWTALTYCLYSYCKEKSYACCCLNLRVAAALALQRWILDAYNSSGQLIYFPGYW